MILAMDCRNRFDMIKNTYQIKKNYNVPVERCFVYVRGRKNVFVPYNLLQAAYHGTHITFVLYDLKSIKRTLYLLNRASDFIDLVVYVDHELTKKEKDYLQRTNESFAVVDKTGLNDEYYKTNDNIFLKTKEVNDILKVDLAATMLEGFPTYSLKNVSCLGKVLYIDKKNNVYFCPKYKDRSYLGKIKENKNFYDCDTFKDVLISAIEKRENCKKTCSLFSVCKGGCAFEECPKALEVTYTRIRQLLHKEISLDDASLVEKRIIMKKEIYSFPKNENTTKD